MKRILSILISLSIIFSSISAASALNIDLPKSLKGFTADVSEMISEYDEAVAEKPAFFTVADDEKESDDTYDTNRLIVKSTRKIDTLNSINYVSGYNDLYILQFENDEDCDKALEYYSALQCVEYVQEDGVYTESAVDETEFNFEEAAIGTSSQYQSDLFGYTNAKSNMGSEEVTIAVVDTGVQNDHEYLAGRVIPTGFDSVYNESCYDKRGHGTHVAGIIVANTKSNVKIKPYKVIGDDGTGTDTQLYLGIQAAIEDGVDIINLSLTRKGESEIVHEAVQNAYNAGITVVAAAGNDNANLNETFYTPACFDEVICVVNIDANKKRASTSNWRFNDTLSAPGVDILSSYVNNTYKIMSGTSMAAPFISCCVAYLLASGDAYSPEEAYNTLYANTQQGAVASIHYVVPGDVISIKSTCAAPVFSYDTCDFGGYLDVELTCDTPGATIMYRTSDMNDNTYYEYTGPIRIEKTKTFSAYAYCDNLKNSSSVSATYTKVKVDINTLVLDENGVLVGYTGTDTAVTVPDYVNGKCVTGVSSSAFSGNETITDITLGQYVTTIEDGAFKDCSALSSVSAVACTEIGDEAFSGCSSLKTLSASVVTTVGDKAFYGCSALTNLTLNKLTNLGERVFEGSGMTTFSATKLQTIGSFAFTGTPVKSLSLSSVTTIGANAFENCQSLSIVAFAAATSVGDDCFKGCDKLTSVTFNKLKSIPENMLEGKALLTTAKFAVATSVGAYAFYGCSSLASLILTKATDIGDYAFYGCSSLSSFTFTKVISVGAYAFSETGLGSVVLPNNPTSLGEMAFYNCNNLKSIELTYAESFDTQELVGADGLEALILPRVTEFNFNGGSFAEVFPELKQFDNNMGIDEIPDGFFEGCSKLEAVVFPYYVYIIGANAFKGTSISEAVFQEAHTFGENCFADIPTLETVTLNKFGNDDDFSIFAGSENIRSIQMNNLTKLPEDFRCLELFGSIAHFNAHIVDVPDYAFKDCSELTSFTFTFTETVGKEAFMGTALKSIVNSNLVTIKQGAFENCGSLEKISLPKIKEIDFSVFKNSTANITELNLRSATTITDSSVTDFDFKEFTSLKTVDISAVEVIPAQFFKSCPLLENVTLNKCTEIGDEAFDGCVALSVIPLNNVISIGANAFRGCVSLETVELEYATTIGENAFDGCVGLKTVELECATTIGENAFNGCTAIETFKADMVTEFDFTSLEGWQNLKNVSFNSLLEFPVDSNNSLDIPGIDNIESFSADSVTVIPAGFLRDKAKLTQISFKAATKIGDYAFYGSGINKAAFSNVTEIGEYSFADCKSLEYIDLASLTVLPLSTFEGCDAVEYMSLGKITELIVGEDGSTYVSDKPLIESFSANKVKVIPESYFENKTNLKNVFCSGAVTIGERAFMNSSLENASCSSVENIGEYAFYGSRLASISSSAIREIGDYAFAKCRYLKDVSLSNKTGNISLGKYAFENDNGLSTVTLSFKDVELPEGCFKNCSNLHQISYDSTTDIADLKYIGDEAFYGCNIMRICNLDLTNVEYIGKNALVGISNSWGIEVGRLVLPNLKFVDEGGFGGLKSVESALFENAEVIRDIPECEYVVIGSDIEEFSCSVTTETVICGYEGSVVEQFCNENNLKFKKYNSTEPVIFNVASVVTGYNTRLSFEAMGFDLSYKWYACNNPDRSDAVPLETSTSDPDEIVPIKLFKKSKEENKYKYFFCVATSTENGNVLDIFSSLSKNLFATIRGTVDTFIDYNEGLIFTDSLDNINTLDNILVVDGDIRVTPSYSTENINCYGTGTRIDIMNGEDVAMSETLVVLGDVNGDGVIDVLDVAEIKMNSDDICVDGSSDAKELAADVNRDDFIDEYDYQAVVNKALA